MDEVEEMLERNGLEDVTWLSSLSESELDMLISLKMLVLRCAKMIGHDNLAENVDLKMLRALGFILMVYFEGKIKDLSLIPGECAAFLDCCNLLKCNAEEIISVEELKALIGPGSKKRLMKSTKVWPLVKSSQKAQTEVYFTGRDSALKKSTILYTAKTHIEGKLASL